MNNFLDLKLKLFLPLSIKTSKLPQKAMKFLILSDLHYHFILIFILLFYSISF
jgi:hypothetical protein